MKRFCFFVFILFFCLGIVGVFSTQNDKPKIAILYIATGRYIIFWDDFYKHMEQNFLPDYDKTYFVWTDTTDKVFPKNVKRIYQKQLPWPYPTLKRFEMFMGQAAELAKYDYIYFFNANMLPKRFVGDEILPTEGQGLVVVKHPGYVNGNVERFPYDRNPKSSAYIPFGKGKFYVMGAFNGGRSDAYLKLIRDLDIAVKKDEKNRIMATWHDESHLNKYILDKNPLILSPAYGYPEEGYSHLSNIKDTYKILILNKRNFGGHDYLRGLSDKKTTH